MTLSRIEMTTLAEIAAAFDELLARQRTELVNAVRGHAAEIARREEAGRAAGPKPLRGMTRPAPP